MRIDTENIEVVAIDLINTIVDRGELLFVDRLAGVLGASLGQRQVISDAYRKRYLEYSMGNYGDDAEFYSAVFASIGFRDPELPVGLLRQWRLECSAERPGATQLLKSLAERYRVIIATNFVKEWADLLTKAYGWEEHIAGMLVSSECGFRKPARSFFRELLLLSGVRDPWHVVMIGDSLVNDIFGASAYGMQALLLGKGDVRGGLCPGVGRADGFDEVLRLLTPLR